MTLIKTLKAAAVFGTVFLLLVQFAVAETPEAETNTADNYSFVRTIDGVDYVAVRRETFVDIVNRLAAVEEQSAKNLNWRNNHSDKFDILETLVQRVEGVEVSIASIGEQLGIVERLLGQTRQTLAEQSPEAISEALGDLTVIQAAVAILERKANCMLEYLQDDIFFEPDQHLLEFDGWRRADLHRERHDENNNRHPDAYGSIYVDAPIERCRT